MPGLHAAKLVAARAALSLVTPNMRLGLGTGSTTAIFIQLLGERVREGLAIEAVATSVASEELARSQGITILPLDLAGELDLTVDGADEVDPDLNLIKGGGGALLREKIVAYHSRQMVVIADHSKLVDVLGRFPLPLEVVQFWWQATSRAIAEFGVTPTLRQRQGRPFLTDNGNLILDCPFGSIPDPAGLASRLMAVPGVVEVGLFTDLADRAFIGSSDGVIALDRQPGS